MKETERIDSSFLCGSRTVWIEHPRGSGSADVLVFLDAELYRNRVGAPGILRECQAARAVLPPLDRVFLGGGTADNRQADFICNPTFADFLACELVPWIAARRGASHRFWLCGLSLSGLAAAHAVTQYPDVFGGAICQSPSAWWNGEWLMDNLQPTAKPRRFWVSVGDQETADNVVHPPTPLVQTVSQLASCRRLAEKLVSTGNEVHFAVFSGGHDPACWGRELPSALDWLLTADPH
jgi:enterochelin esterase-like enzyme